MHRSKASPFPTQPSTRAVSVHQAWPSHPLILVIDEDPTESALLQEAFREAGCPASFTRFGSPLEALLFLSETARRGLRPADVVLLDLWLPKFPSTTLLEQVRRGRSHPHIPIMIYSAHLTESFRRECHALGAAACVEKPTAFRHYEAVVDQILGVIADSRDG